MKKTKVENVSSMILDFFLKQNKEDVRVALRPGEFSWCDPESSTKSMILYERKNLIKTSPELETTIDDTVDINNDEVLDKLHITENVGTIEIKTPPQTNNTIEIITPSQVVPDLVEFLNNDIRDNTVEVNSEEEIQEPKKEYKGKKRGRKKKRGPKPGSKKKNINSLPTIAENKDTYESTGNTSIYFSD